MADLFAKCGNNCGRCALYVGNLTDETRQWCAEGMARYIGWNPTPGKLRACAGCQSQEGFHYLKNCAVRLCAFHNEAETCAHCAVFPCREVPTVSLSPDYRAQVAERLGEPVPEADYAAFIEPYEGMAHLEVLREALAPGDLVAIKPVKPLRARRARFPDDLPLSGQEAAALGALYTLMTAILTGRAELYVHQMQLRQTRKEILNLLWVFGRYGQAEAGGAPLAISSETHWARADFRNVVRKRDNTLHTTTARAIERLADFGVRVEHVPVARKAWWLTMSFDEDIGGTDATGALQRYVAGLLETYGEPEYAGSSRYKGQAYERFSRADMRVLC